MQTRFMYAVVVALATTTLDYQVVAANSPRNQPVVGIKECDLYSTQEMKQQVATLTNGTKVTLEKALPDALHVKTASGANGWVWRCALCSEEEYSRRKRNNEVPLRTICVGANKDGQTFLYGGTIPIRNNGFALEAGQAVWMDETAKGRTFTVASHPLVGNSKVLFLYKGTTVAQLPIWQDSAAPPSSPSAGKSTRFVYAIAEQVRLRVEPDPDSSLAPSPNIPFGKEMLLVGEQGHYLQVKVPGEDSEGWLHRACVTFSQSLPKDMDAVGLRPNTIIFIPESGIKGSGTFQVVLIEGRIRVGAKRFGADEGNCIVTDGANAAKSLGGLSMKGFGVDQTITSPKPWTLYFYSSSIGKFQEIPSLIAKKKPIIASPTRPKEQPAILAPAKATSPAPASPPSAILRFLWRSVLVLPITLAVCLFLTHPQEFRRSRWWKTGLTLALMWGLALWLPNLSAPDFHTDQDGYNMNFAVTGLLLALAILLVVIWIPNLSHQIMELIGAVTEPADAEGSRVPLDLREVYRAIKRDDFHNALQLVKEQLRRHPDDFEARTLAARLQYQLGDMLAFRETVQGTLDNPHLLAAHRQLAEEMLQEADKAAYPEAALAPAGSPAAGERQFSHAVGHAATASETCTDSPGQNEIVSIFRLGTVNPDAPAPYSSVSPQPAEAPTPCVMNFSCWIEGRNLSAADTLASIGQFGMPQVINRKALAVIQDQRLRVTCKDASNSTVTAADISLTRISKVVAAPATGARRMKRAFWQGSCLGLVCAIVLLLRLLSLRDGHFILVLGLAVGFGVVGAVAGGLLAMLLKAITDPSRGRKLCAFRFHTGEQEGLELFVERERQHEVATILRRMNLNVESPPSERSAPPQPVKAPTKLIRQSPITEGGQPNYFVRHWRGDLSLGVSYWVNGFLATVLVLLMAGSVSLFRDSMDLKLIALLTLLLYLGGILATVWQWVGIWRSASNHVWRGGKAVWATLTKAAVVIGGLNVLVLAITTYVPQAVEMVSIVKGDNGLPPYQIRVLPGGTEVEFRGGLRAGAAKELERILTAVPQVKVLHINGPGGRITEGRAIMQLVRERGLTTYTSEECMSAATLVLMSGKERVVAAGAKVGFHAGSLPGATAEQQREMDDLVRTTMQSAGVTKEFTDRVLATPSDHMWFPSYAEMKASHVVTSESYGERFASSWALSNTNSDDVLQKELDQVPCFSLIRELEPDTYAQMVADFMAAINSGKSEGEAVAAVGQRTAGLLERYLPAASDSALVALRSQWIDILRRYKDENSQGCIAVFTQAKVNYSRIFPDWDATNSLRVVEQVIRSGKSGARVAVDKKAASQDLERISRNLAGRYGENLALLQQQDQWMANSHKVCDMLLAMYQQMESLPDRRGANLLRFMVASKE